MGSLLVPVLWKGQVRQMMPGITGSVASARALYTQNRSISTLAGNPAGTPVGTLENTSALGIWRTNSPGHGTAAGWRRVRQWLPISTGNRIGPLGVASGGAR